MIQGFTTSKGLFKHCWLRKNIMSAELRVVPIAMVKEIKIRHIEKTEKQTTDRYS